MCAPRRVSVSGAPHIVTWTKQTWIKHHNTTYLSHPHHNNNPTCFRDLLVELLEQEVAKPILNVHQIALDLLRQIFAEMAALALHLKLVLGMLGGGQRFFCRGLVHIVDEAVATFLARDRVVDVHRVEHLPILKARQTIYPHQYLEIYRYRTYCKVKYKSTKGTLCQSLIQLNRFKDKKIKLPLLAQNYGTALVHERNIGTVAHAVPACTVPIAFYFYASRYRR